MRKLIPILLSSILMTPLSSYALGLGDIKVKSALNEPFRADIQLVSADGLPFNDIRVDLASDKEFVELDVEKSTVLSKLQFNIAQDESGHRIIRVTSKDRITEPYLNILLHVNWPSGEFLRAYTVLLDPPSYTVASHSTVMSNTTVSPKPESSIPIVVKKPVKKPAPPVVHHEVQNVKQVAPTLKAQEPTKTVITHESVQLVTVREVQKPSIISKSSYGPTKSKDSLWLIAKKISKGTDLSISQTMLAIVWANPQAFQAGNMNRMKLGAHLNIPTVDEIRRIDNKQAQQEVNAHHVAWRKHIPIHHVMKNSLSSTTRHEIPTPTKQLITTPSLIMKKENPHTIETNPLLQSPISGTTSDAENKLRAELAVSLEETAHAHETNEVMQQQFALLQDQNQALQKQLLQRTTELAVLKKQLERWQTQSHVNNTTETRAGVSGQATAILPNQERPFWSKLSYSLLTLLGLGGLIGFFARNRLVKDKPENIQVEEIPTKVSTAPSSRATSPVEGLAGEDIISTKLDLATAYINMEEFDRAEEILLGIKHRGSVEQQQEVLHLLSEIKETAAL